MEKVKNHACILDPERGFFVKQNRISSQKNDLDLVVMVAPFRDAKRFSDIMNYQFEII